MGSGLAGGPGSIPVVSMGLRRGRLGEGLWLNGGWGRRAEVVEGAAQAQAQAQAVAAEAAFPVATYPTPSHRLAMYRAGWFVLPIYPRPLPRVPLGSEVPIAEPSAVALRSCHSNSSAYQCSRGCS